MSINIRLKHKKDTAANWTSKNPVLLDGEIVLVDDNGTLRIKMGDGVTNFTLLPYFDAPMHAHIDNQNNPHKVTKAQVGLGNVDNTADANKSVNYATSAGHAITADGLTNVTATAAELNVLDGITATTAELNVLDGITATTAELNYVDGVTSNIQTQLNAKAALASPTLTGTPKAPTASAGTNTTQIATTAFVTTALSNKTSVSGNAGTATKLKNARTITLDGDVSGSVSFDGSDNVTITTTVADDSHNHTIANVDNLQANLDAKAPLASPALVGTPTAPTATAGTNTTQIATTAFVTTAVANKTSVASATSASKLTSNGGSATQPIYFENGVPKATNYSLEASVPSGAKFTDTVYTHPSHTAKSSGLYKITVDSNGHVSAATAVAKSDITGLGIPAQDTVYTLPTASSTLGGVKTTSTVTSTSGLTACPIISGVPYYKDTNNTYTLSSFSVTATAAELNVLDGITATTAELNYCDGVTSNIQTQLNGKLSTSGTAAKATADASGNTITSTYETKANAITGLSVSGKTITYTKGNGTTGTITTQDTNTTYSTMGAATSSAAGTSGLVPAPAAGKQASFLRGDGTWVVPTNTTYTAMTASEATTGTATTARSITAKVLHDKIKEMVSASTASIPLKSYT